MRKFVIQAWRCSNGDSEIQHFLNRGTYVFGFNRALMGEVAYKRVLEIVHSALKGNKGVEPVASTQRTDDGSKKKE